MTEEGLLAFDFPHRSLGAGGQLTFDDRPINLTAHIKEGNVALVFFGSVTYQHVFDHTKFVEEPFCYAFDAETTTLRRAPTPNSKEQQKKAN